MNYHHNIDTACVEVLCGEKLILAIDCIASENMFAGDRFEHAELDYLLYNDPAACAELVLTGDLEAYLKAVTE